MRKYYHSYIDSYSGLSNEIWWLSLITLINRTGAMVIPFLSIYLKEDMSLSLGQIGWIMTSFGLGSVLGSYIGGKLTDSFGFYKVIIFSLLISGTLFIGLQYLDTFEEFLVGIFIVIAVTDALRPAVFVAVNAYSKKENRTRSLTLIRLAINLGFSMGPALGGIIITTLSYGGLFWVDGLSCIAAGLLILVVLPRQKYRKKEPETSVAQKSAYTDLTYLIFIGSMIIFGVVFMQYFSSIPVFFKDEILLSEFEIGLLLSLNGFFAFAFEMPLVKWLETTNLTVVSLIGIGFVLLAVSLTFLYTSVIILFVLAIILMSLSEMIIFPFSNAYALERADGGNQGEYMAFYSIAFSIGHIVGHNAVFQLIEYSGYHFTWTMMLVTLFIGLVLLWFMKRRIEREKL